MGSRMTGADGDHLPMPAMRDPWLAIAAFLAKEAETLKTDPGFAASLAQREAANTRCVCPGCALLPCTALRESAAGRLTLFDTAASKGAD